MICYIFSNLYLFLIAFLFCIKFTSTLDCFDCNNCDDIATCTCDTIKPTSVNTEYCFLLRENILSGTTYEIKIASNDYTPYITDPYYISVEETISYNQTTKRWSSISNKIIYGCQTDRCNRLDLLKKLPATGLSLMLPLDWLNEKFLRISSIDTTICRDCFNDDECGQSMNIISKNQCNIVNCQGSCMISQKLRNVTTALFCYESICTDDTSFEPKLQLPLITITAVYYINKNKLETVEIDAVCNGGDCSQLQLFDDVKSKLQKDLSGIKPFLPENHGNAIYSKSSTVLILIFLQIVVFY